MIHTPATIPPSRMTPPYSTNNFTIRFIIVTIMVKLGIQSLRAGSMRWDDVACLFAVLWIWYSNLGPSFVVL
ncbi:uncharacterized protein EAF02_002285 [Botrytis sinoallii]|uniref:uncharacterized protein n=1 Tax=Botrytis sinoallii TaxID=1463999 RepID=UPI001902AF49|nr:uncharacterized protein EAF02_002285 [Botrytis sinoallii]KAF7889870.1 hypothetical protein EAF02_002285 [Botrytis sinoallii]